jgi:1-acyl-sn-glycerol-3-phosphate acyltransferase
VTTIIKEEGMVWPAQKSHLSSAFEAFCKTVFKLYCPLTVEGRENLPEPPFVICSNHASHIDSSMLMMALDMSFKKIGLIAAKDYFFDQSHRFFLHYMMNLVPIARGAGSGAIRDSIIACRSFLASGGEVLIIYPEGTRATSDKISHFKEGAAILSHELGLPMVPACVYHSRECLPKGSYMLRPTKLKVRFGNPVRVSDFLNVDEADDRKAKFHAYREATLKVEAEVRRMASENG